MQGRTWGRPGLNLGVHSRRGLEGPLPPLPEFWGRHLFRSHLVFPGPVAVPTTVVTWTCSRCVNSPLVTCTGARRRQCTSHMEGNPRPGLVIGKRCSLLVPCEEGTWGWRGSARSALGGQVTVPQSSRPGLGFPAAQVKHQWDRRGPRTVLPSDGSRVSGTLRAASVQRTGPPPAAIGLFVV